MAEVGAGRGTFSDLILAQASPSRLLLLEPDPRLASLLAEKYAADSRVRVIPGYLEQQRPAEEVDTVIAVNVLEHVEDDARWLISAYQALTPGGKLLLFVPAFRWLYGTIDRAHGHFRRYDKASLRARLEKAGFHPGRIFYFNFVGVLSWFLAGKVFRHRTLQASQVGFYDRWIVPWLSRLEGFAKPPLGQSLVAIAQR